LTAPADTALHPHLSQAAPRVWAPVQQMLLGGLPEQGHTPCGPLDGLGGYPRAQMGTALPLCTEDRPGLVR
jgi:hypothetical protein